MKIATEACIKILADSIKQLSEVVRMLDREEQHNDEVEIKPEEAKAENEIAENDFTSEVEYFFLNYIDQYPLECLYDIFKFCGDDSIKNDLYNWCRLAICSEKNNQYYEGKDRSRLLIFCENLQHLIEALYVLIAAWAKDNEVNKLPFMNSYLFLSDVEKHDPFSVIENFRRRFPVAYTQLELWYLLDAVISFEGRKEINDIMRGNIMYDYEIFLCMAKAAYRLEREDEALSSVLKKLKNHGLEVAI